MWSPTDGAHSRGKSHLTNEKTSRSQTTFIRTENGTVKMTDRKFFLSQDEKVMKAETLNALHYVQYSLSYSSATQHSALFKVIFPDSSIAQAFKSTSVKIAYIIKYDLGERSASCAIHIQA